MGTFTSSILITISGDFYHRGCAKPSRDWVSDHPRGLARSREMPRQSRYVNDVAGVGGRGPKNKIPNKPSPPGHESRFFSSSSRGEVASVMGAFVVYRSSKSTS